MRIKSKKPWIISLSAAVALLIFLQWKIELHWGASARAAEEFAKSAESLISGKPAADSPALLADEGHKSTNASLEDLLKAKGEEVALLQDHPEKSDQELSDWAQRLTDKDVQDLRSPLLNREWPTDEAALAIELLGRTSLSSATTLLKDFVLDSSGANAPGPSADDARMMQLFALDSLVENSARPGQKNSLNEIAQKSEDSLLAQRARQALQALEGRAPMPAQTDQKFLQEVLQKNPKRGQRR